MSDKLNIPLAELSRDTASAVLTEKQTAADDIALFLSIIDECEFARYAPASGRQAMQQLYQQAATVISKLEQTIRT
jgi:hypothetical protein